MPVTSETQPIAKDRRRGNALGGRGGPEDELLIEGQEEVFSRTEVELGRIEHHTDTQTPPRAAETSDNAEESAMPRGDKSSYTDKQERKADHIADGYKDRGVSAKEAERRAWATVNKEDGGGKKSGSGRGKAGNPASARKGGAKGGAASASRSKADRSAAAKKGWETRRKKAGS